MRLLNLATIVTVLAVVAAGSALADKGGTPHGGGSGGGSSGGGQADPSCAVAPNPAEVGQSFLLSASGLPTADSVWLLVYAPSGDATVSQIYVNSDGSWSGSEVANQTGRWTYVFSGLLANNRYGTVATCTEQVG